MSAMRDLLALRYWIDNDKKEPLEKALLNNRKLPKEKAMILRELKEEKKNLIKPRPNE